MAFENDELFISFGDGVYSYHGRSSHCLRMLGTFVISSYGQLLGSFGPHRHSLALGELSIGLVILGGIVTTGMFCIYIEELIYIYRNWPFKFFFLKLGCLSIFPVVGFCFFLNLLVPRATDYTTTAVILCLPAPLVLFFWVVIGYASKERYLLERLEDKLMPLRGPPCCCLCWCCPKIPFSKQRFNLVKACIYQFFLTPVALFVVGTICSKYGVFKELKFTPDNAAPYLVVLNFVSFFIGVYGLVIFMNTTSKLLTGFHIKGKFLSLQLQFILVRFHFFTFDTFGRLGFFPCHPPISSMMTAFYIRSALLLGEGFILTVVGRFFFLHTPPPHFMRADPAHHINPNT